jgi:dipeptidyl-peptidase 4
MVKVDSGTLRSGRGEVPGNSQKFPAENMRERYRRAVALTAPKICAVTAGVAIDGYWINEREFYFAADHFDSALRRMVPVPSIVDCESQRVTAVIELEELANLLSEQAGHVIDRTALADATFDLQRPSSQNPEGVLAVSLQDRHYSIDVSTHCVLEARPALSMPALYSPDGRFACFLKEDNLWIREQDTGVERALTNDGSPHNAYGYQTETCLSALSYRQRPNPMGLWSSDSQWFLTHRIDERAVPELALVQNVPPGGARPILQRYKYCVPGDPLPIATLVAVHVATGRALKFNEFPAEVMTTSPFGSRTVWFGASRNAFMLRMDRHFKRADLIELNLTTGTGRAVLSETTESGYLELHQLLTVTPNVRTLQSGEIVWFSERDGHAHLYLYDGASGALKNRITQGDWIVRDIVHVDEASRRIIFTACGIDAKADPVHRSVCAVNLDGSSFEILLTHEGDIALPRTEPAGLDQTRPFCPTYAQPGMSTDGRFGVARFTNVVSGNSTRIVDFQTGHSFEIIGASPQPESVQARHFEALSADGVTKLHGTLFLPPDFDASRRYPLVDYIYPGPQTNVHPQSFNAVSSAPATVLAELGMASFMVDTRGMPFRHKALRQDGYGDLASAQLADHAAVVRQLCEQYDFIDPERVAVFGQSGGGYAAARAMFEYGEIYKVGVSVCGNHDSNLYSAVWSEKYRGPDDQQTFAGQANAAMAHQLTGKLLLISGDMDENVHVSQTLAVVDALVRANRDFELLIVPNEDHLLLMKNGYVQRRIWDFLVRQLLEATPPRDFAIEYEPHELQRMFKSWVWEWRT